MPGSLTGKGWTLYMVHLEEINEENWRTPLRVRDEQQRYVSDPMRLLARAYAYRNSRSQALLILEDDTPVGMTLFYDCAPLNAYDFSQLFIDQRYQGRGLGIAAAKLVLDWMVKDGKYDKVVLCYIEGNEASRNLCQKLGFVLTGERDGDELIMEKALRKSKKEG